ncbi:DUF488 domain-containing protein [Streptomyces sp. NPDC058695]|uniref:DUF488 domain-containing protein n=1 Tax=Streptomyces sp. NPDC058695 TaxID=3346604 RepID=UPI00364F986E
MPSRQRIYEDTPSRNGKRVLVDRLWPRGMSKERAHLDEWIRDVAPPAAGRPSASLLPETWRPTRARRVPGQTIRTAAGFTTHSACTRSGSAGEGVDRFLPVVSPAGWVGSLGSAERERRRSALSQAVVSDSMGCGVCTKTPRSGSRPTLWPYSPTRRPVGSLRLFGMCRASHPAPVTSKPPAPILWASVSEARRTER